MHARVALNSARGPCDGGRRETTRRKRRVMLTGIHARVLSALEGYSIYQLFPSLRQPMTESDISFLGLLLP